MSEKLSKTGRAHDALEHWLGKHNRKLELLRTLFSLLGAVASSIVLAKMFGFI